MRLSLHPKTVRARSDYINTCNFIGVNPRFFYPPIYTDTDCCLLYIRSITVLHEVCQYSYTLQITVFVLM